MSERDPLIARLEAVEASNRTLVQQLDELRRQLAATQPGGFRAMRDSRRCPACGSGSLLHIRRATESGGTTGTIEFALVQDYSKWMGTTKTRGEMEAFACRGCGLVEWHVIDFKGVVADGTTIVAIDPEPDPPKAGPFR